METSNAPVRVMGRLNSPSPENCSIQPMSLSEGAEWPRGYYRQARVGHSSCLKGRSSAFGSCALPNRGVGCARPALASLGESGAAGS